MRVKRVGPDGFKEGTGLGDGPLARRAREFTLGFEVGADEPHNVAGERLRRLLRGGMLGGSFSEAVFHVDSDGTAFAVCHNLRVCVFLRLCADCVKTFSATFCVVMGESIGIYFSEDLLGRAQKRAEQTHKGKFSTYVTDAVERELQGLPPDAMSPTIVLDLARRLLGEPDALRMLARVGKADQPLLLRELLRGFMDGQADARRVAEEGVEYGGGARPILTVETGDAREERLRREARAGKRKHRSAGDEGPEAKAS